MKLSEAKFCVEPDCEELAHRSVQLCPCGSAQFFDLSYLADPEAHRFKRLERRRARQLAAISHRWDLKRPPCLV